MLYNQCFRGMTWPYQNGPRFPQRGISSRIQKRFPGIKVSRVSRQYLLFYEGRKTDYGKKTRQS